MTPVFALLLTLAAGADTAAPPPTPHVVDSSFTAPDGSPTLEQSAVIEAPVAVLWRAYVEPKEFARWNAPVAAIDLRVGGLIEASYDPAAKIGDPNNVKNRIITYIPERLLVLQDIQAPKGFPHPEVFQRTVSVVRYEPLSPNRTRVIIDVTGWGDTPDDRRLYGFFRAGDGELLEKMRAVYGAGR